VVPDWLEEYLGLEQSASVIRTYDVQFLPGLLQTPDYARAVLSLGLDPGDAAQARLEQSVMLQAQRQEILHRPGSPRLWAVIDEGALRRMVGGASVMRTQIRRLAEITRLDHVIVQVMPLRIGQAAVGGPITLLRFPEGGLADVVYLEQLGAAVYLRKPAETGPYWSALNRLATGARLPSATPAILREILAQT
jgi:hypothetical protein